MLVRNALRFVVLLGATAASAATLPLKTGTYVLADVPCHDPALAAMFAYDGRQFSYPHATKCRSFITSHRGNAYQVEETCSALGDGGAATPTTIKTTYIVLSPTQVRVSQAHLVPFSYRWCPSPPAKRGL
jgi:hypothetical protein